jgi:asparagine synthase (glutamine-hydrolysing)
VGEPFADVGLLPMAGISRAAREHITVALSGDGGDESFAGYPNVLAARRAERFRQSVPALLRRGIGAAAGLFSEPLPQAARARRWLEGYVERKPAGQLDAANHWSARWRAALYHPEMAARAAEAGAERLFATLLADAGELCNAEQHLLADLRLRLPGDFLTKVDIGSNLASLEVRSPFLDHRVVELAAGLPLDLKLLGGRQKGLLRRLAERHLPAELVAAPKRGFAPHVGDWMRGPWAPMARELCHEPATVRAGLFDGVVITRVADEHLRGAVDHSERLWSFLCLEIWWRLFVDRSLSPGDAP